MLVSRPHEEDWTADGDQVWCHHPKCGPLRIARVDALGVPPLEFANAKLIAAAPAMARLLLSDVMWHHARCVACDGHRHQGGHTDDCELVAVLRAAGVLP